MPTKSPWKPKPKAAPCAKCGWIYTDNPNGKCCECDPKNLKRWQNYQENKRIK